MYGKLMHIHGFKLIHLLEMLENEANLNKVVHYMQRPIFFCRVLHTMFSHLRAHVIARSATVARSSAVQASSGGRRGGGSIACVRPIACMKVQLHA